MMVKDRATGNLYRYFFSTKKYDPWGGNNGEGVDVANCIGLPYVRTTGDVDPQGILVG